MRILVYLEPYPIRNEFSHYLNIGEIFSRISSKQEYTADLDSSEILIYSNRNTTNALREKFPNAKYVNVTDHAQETYEHFYRDWEQGGMNFWTENIINWGDFSFEFYSHLEHLYRDYRFDVIVYWGNSAIVKELCKKNNVKSIFMELGHTRPPFLQTYVMDTVGVNRNSFIYNLKTEDINNSYLKELEPIKLSVYELSQNLNHQNYTDQFNLSSDLIGKIDHQKKIIFIPLQLHDDSNTLVFTDLVGSSELINKTIEKFPPDDYFYIVKEHPASKYRTQTQFENSNAYSLLNNVTNDFLWVKDEFKTIPLIMACDFVVTINSTVGFEALILKKPVYTFGATGYLPKYLADRMNSLITQHHGDIKIDPETWSVVLFVLKFYLIKHERISDYQGFISCIKSTLHSMEMEDDYSSILNRFFTRNLDIDDRKIFAKKSLVRPIRNFQRSLDSKEKIKKKLNLYFKDSKLYYENSKIFKFKKILHIYLFLKNHLYDYLYSQTSNYKYSTQNSINEIALDPIQPIKLDFEKDRNKSFLAICHLYYLDMVPDILSQIKIYANDLDLIFTVPKLGGEKISKLIYEEFPFAHVAIVDDLGGDILPFLRALSSVNFREYKAILKLHTKKGYFKFGKFRKDLGEIWLRVFLENLLPNTKINKEVLLTEISSDNFTMASAAGLVRRIDEYPCTGVDKVLSHSFSDLNISSITSSRFAAGSMFWINPEIASSILNRTSMSCFTDMSSQNHRYEHVIERIFGVVACSFGQIKAFNFNNMPLFKEGLDEALPIEDFLKTYIRWQTKQ